jgi:two-component system cell cycle response regulator
MMTYANAQLDLALIAEDRGLRNQLSRDFISHGYSVATAPTAEEGLRLIDLRRPKVVVCLENADRSIGVEICRQVRHSDASLSCSVFVLQGEADQEAKREALLAGADDCLAAPFDQIELLAKVRNAVRQANQLWQWRQAAMTDGLTGLWNHTQFRERLDAEYSRTRRYGGELALLMIDLDHFKQINDTYGHEVGNAVLAQTSAVLGRMVRESDIVARYGGEEFVVICPQTSLVDAQRLGERIRRALPAVVRLQDGERRVHASIGVAAMSDLEVDSPAALITLADQALYAAKNNGRDQVVTSASLVEHAAVAEPDPIVASVDPKPVSISAVETLGPQSVAAIEQTWASRDQRGFQHATNVANWAEAFTLAAGWPEDERAATIRAARWHDLGTLGIPDQVLNKPERLSPAEFALVRRVPDLTCRMLSPLACFQREVSLIRHLRERFDGSGYPDGLAGESIPRGSRLLLIIEAFDSLVSPRPYREAVDAESALALLQQESGIDFDPNLLRSFAGLVQGRTLLECDLWTQST